jgi:hypothetical protein
MDSGSRDALEAEDASKAAGRRARGHRWKHHFVAALGLTWIATLPLLAMFPLHMRRTPSGWRPTPPPLLERPDQILAAAVAVLVTLLCAGVAMWLFRVAVQRRGRAFLIGVVALGLVWMAIAQEELWPPELMEPANPNCEASPSTFTVYRLAWEELLLWVDLRLRPFLFQALPALLLGAAAVYWWPRSPEAARRR